MTSRTIAPRFGRRLLAVSAAVVVGGAALAGCSSDSDSSDSAKDSETTSSQEASPESEETEDGSSGSGDSPEAGRISAMMLTAADLPSGYQAQEIPRDEMRQMLKQMTGALEDADVEPASCVDFSLMPKDLNPDDMGMLVGVAGTGVADARSIAEIISTEGMSVGDQRSLATGECEDITAVMRVEGQSVESRAITEEIDAPDTDADDAIVFRQSSTAAVAGTAPIESSAMIGYAEVNGYFVSVQFMSLSGDDVDEDEFMEFFTEAVNKAAANS